MWLNTSKGGADNFGKMAEAIKELFISYGREPETVNFVRLLKRDLEKRGSVVPAMVLDSAYMC